MTVRHGEVDVAAAQRLRPESLDRVDAQQDVNAAQVVDGSAG